MRVRHSTVIAVSLTMGVLACGDDDAATSTSPTSTVSSAPTGGAPSSTAPTTTTSAAPATTGTPTTTTVPSGPSSCADAPTPTVLAGSHEDELVVVGFDGRERWRSAVDGEAGFNADTYQLLPGIVVVQTPTGTVELRAAQDGTVLGAAPGDHVEVTPDCGVVVSGSGTITVLDPSGLPRWTRNGDGGIVAGPNGEVVLLAVDGATSGSVVDAATGATRWSTPAWDDLGVAGSVIVGEVGDVATYYDALTGEQLWSGLGGDHDDLDALDARIEDTDDGFIVVDLRTGEQLLARRGTVEAAAPSGGVYYVDDAGNAGFIGDPRSAVDSWTTPGGAVLAASDELALVRLDDRTLRAIEPAGHVRWEVPGVDGEAMILDDVVVLVDDEAGTTILSAIDGSPAAHIDGRLTPYPLGAHGRGAPPPVLAQRQGDVIQVIGIDDGVLRWTAPLA